MTDISAAMGIAALEEWEDTVQIRRSLLSKYEELITDRDEIQILGRTNPDIVHGAWLCTIRVKRRKDLQEKLWRNKIETNQVHYRNDRYSVFGGRKGGFPNMDAMEHEYLVLPLHTKMTVHDVERVAELINSGW
jgi:dTDP-4-amino-4,6-dideoxygalactose transaminase